MGAPRVEVYYNLHKKCLSYRPSKGAVRHAQSMLLNDVTLSVQPAGRERVLTERRKNVHAFVRGVPVYVRGIGDADDGDLSHGNMKRQGYRLITYNPYKHKTFVYADTGEPAHHARQVAVIGNKIWEVQW